MSRGAPHNPTEGTSNPSNTGRTLGKYRLLARLGQGGMAEVFLAVVAGPGGFSKLVVVKVMKPELLEEPDSRTMFLDEGRLAARLNHPNIVQTNEVGIEGESHFIAMEFLDGQPLHRILRRAKKADGIPLNWHLYFLAEVLHALEYAHAVEDYDGTPLRMVHRDVTPHNVFVTYTGQVKLCDFGIAKTMSSSVETQAGVLKGKVSYMAPEQVLSAQLDRRADLFSVGVMLWEAATSKRMWKDQSDLQIMQALSHGRVPNVREANPSIDPELEAVVNRALAPRPEDRYQSAAEFRQELEGFLFGRTARIKPKLMGEWVQSLFEKERKNLQAVVQDQLAGSGSAPPALDPPRIVMSDSNPSRSVHGPGTPAPSLTIPSVELKAPTQRRTLAAVMGALLATVVFLIIAIVVVVARSRTVTPTPMVEAAPVSPEAETVEAKPPPAATDTAPRRVRVRVQVSPKSAKLTLDGNQLSDNPWVGEVPAGPGEHVLTVEADGYQSVSRMLKFDENQNLEIQLRRATTAAAAPPKATAEEPKKPDDFPDLTAQPKKKPPTAPLDTADPWNQ